MYTGPVYYSSTTISDIPTTDLWLNNMVNILSGITGECFSYYVFDDTTTGIPSIDNPRTIVVQGCCSGGTDMWGVNGPTPGTFLAEACLNLNGVYASISAKDTDIYSFYDTTSTPGDTMFAAKTAIDSFGNGMRTTGWSGKTYHIPLFGDTANDERWLGWSSYPSDGHAIRTSSTAPNTCHTCWSGNEFQLGNPRKYCEPENGGFAVWPDEVPDANMPPNGNFGVGNFGLWTGGSKNVIIINFVDESDTAYYDTDKSGTFGALTQPQGPPVPGGYGPLWGNAVFTNR